MISFSNHDNCFSRKLLIRVNLTIFLLIQCNLFAQSNNVDFVRLKIGLSQNTVTSIYQDSTGFMWFGTLNGLNKYDGTTTTIYEYIPGDTNSLSDNRIYKIIEGNEGELWVATNRGLNFLKKDDYKFKRYLSNDSENSLPDNLVADVFRRHNGEIWVIANNPCKYNPTNDGFKEYILNYKRPSREESFFFQDKQNNLWFVHMTEKLFEGLPDGYDHK